MLVRMFSLKTITQFLFPLKLNTIVMNTYDKMVLMVKNKEPRCTSFVSSKFIFLILLPFNISILCEGWWPFSYRRNNRHIKITKYKYIYQKRLNFFISQMCDKQMLCRIWISVAKAILIRTVTYSWSYN